jgi:hypothetical protein
MNQKELQTRRNNTRRLFNHTSGIHVNCVRINIRNSLIHEQKKFEICWQLKSEGKDFITEAETPDKKCRLDIVNLDDAEGIEILNSEELDSFNEKESRYPIKIRYVKC